MARWLPVLLLALLGACLVALALPRTVAAWLSLPAQSAIEKLQNGKSPSEAELGEGIKALTRGISWVPSGRRQTDLGLLELELSERPATNSQERGRLLASAEQHLVAGLVASPTNGFAWLRLAIVRELRQAPPRQVAAALAQSLDMAPNTRKLWLPRIGLLFVYWRDLTFEELLAMRAQLRTIWQTVPAMRQSLIQISTRSGQLALLSWALTDSPPLAEEIERLKATLPPPQR